jgi:hypothetical protein
VYKELILESETLKVTLQDRPTKEDLIAAISMFSWLCQALREPNGEQPVSLSSAEYSVLPGLELSVILRLEPLELRQYNCWLALFVSAVVTEYEDLKGSFKPHGKGLEVSFDLMTALAAVDFSITVNGGTILLGYRTALIPTKVEDDCVQFHLEVSEDDQINPYILSCSQQALITDLQQFRNMRCFVGWCESAHIYLGTERLSAAVKYSGAKEKERTLHLSGISAGGQAVTAGPVQAGFVGQVNYSFTANRVRFTPSNNFAHMLGNTSKQLAIVYDRGERRSWLVPKLSLLLHMCHAWVSDQGFHQDPIPFVNPHFNGDAVVDVLKDAGDTVVCGQGQDTLKLRRLLLGLSINLLSSINNIEKTKGKNIYGFEFMDIVTEPAQGGCMKEIPIIKEGRSWLMIANDVDAVVICSGVGEVITPAQLQDRRCTKCNSLPKGMDYLAAPLTCLGQLAKRRGVELESLLRDSQIALSKDSYWNVSGDPFAVCTHDDGSNTTCWERPNLFQHIVTQNPIMSWFFGRKNQTFSANMMDTANSVSLIGAIVFGKQACH